MPEQASASSSGAPVHHSPLLLQRDQVNQSTSKQEHAALPGYLAGPDIHALDTPVNAQETAVSTDAVIGNGTHGHNTGTQQQLTHDAKRDARGYQPCAATA